MSLIKCPDCGKNLSNGETSCPHCGTPFRAEEIEVDTDLTGKRYRLYTVLSVLVCSLGWILLFSGDESSVQTGRYFVLIGVIGYIGTKILTWRRHK